VKEVANEVANAVGAGALDHAADCDPMVPSLYRVARVARESADTSTLDLVPVAGEMPAFQPGQFNMLYAFGVGEIPISMSGDAADRSCFVHTIRVVGAVSRALVACAVGDVIGLRGPFGTPWPVDAAFGQDVLIVAGGLGLAPLRPAIYAILHQRERYRRVIVLLGMRSPSDIFFADELAQWRARGDVEIRLTVDHADAAWQGDVGVVPSLIPKLGLDPQMTLALVCGPEVMMRFTATALRDVQVPLDRIYLSMERNMKCAIGLCGHCQFGPTFVCKDGPVMRFDRIAQILSVREI